MEPEIVWFIADRFDWGEVPVPPIPAANGFDAVAELFGKLLAYRLEFESRPGCSPPKSALREMSSKLFSPEPAGAADAPCPPNWLAVGDPRPSLGVDSAVPPCALFPSSKSVPRVSWPPVFMS